MSNPTNDAARWRKPEEELPEVGVRVEAWYRDPYPNSNLLSENYVYWDGHHWIEDCPNWAPVVTCLAWRPIQPLDKPSWIP